MAGKQRWVPLESNPKVLNKYIENLGVPPEWQFVDIFGLEPELLMMVPQPVLAVMLLYPITDKSKATELGKVDKSACAYFVKQTIGNACGTVAIVHALANNEDRIKFIDGKHFGKFLADTEALSPEKKAEYLESDLKMGSAHEDSAQEGQTEAPSADEKVNTHFVALVCRDNKLFEMNGSCDGPIYHMDTTPDTLLTDAALVAKKFMERDPGEVNFTLLALAKAE